jgi:hypothetical protein
MERALWIASLAAPWSLMDYPVGVAPFAIGALLHLTFRMPADRLA